MTTDRQLERLLDGWFAEGPTVVADRVIDDMAGRIAHQPQLPAWRLRAQRLPPMSTPARLALVAAALGLALLAGGILLAGSRDAVPPDGPQPASVLPPLPAADPLPDGAITAGQYAIRPGGANGMTFVTTIADGNWVGSGGLAIQGPRGPNAPEGLALVYVANPAVRDDPCRPWSDDWDGSSSDSADNLIAGFRGLHGATVTNLIPVTLDGYPGSRFDLQLPSTLPCDPYFPLAEPNAINAQGPANRWRIWLLDIGGGVETGMIALLDFAGTPARDRAAAEEMVETSRVGYPMPMENGPLQPGAYGVPTNVFRTGGWAFTVPKGWSGIRDWAIYPTGLGMDGWNASGVPNGLGVAYLGASEVVMDPCGTGSLSDTSSVADLVAAIRSKPDWLVSAPVDVELGGLRGQRLDVELPADATTSCGRYEAFREPGEGDPSHRFHAQGPSNRLRVWVIDVHGLPLVFVRSSFAATPADKLAEADAIIDSFVLSD